MEEVKEYTYDYNKIIKEVKKLNIPKKYWKVNLKAFFEHDYYMMLSIRQDAGKTTMWLLLGMVVNYLYGVTIEYLRSDDKQLVRKSTETMFDVIKKFGYIERLWEGEYNDIVYKPMLKKWQLVHRNENGEIDKTHPDYICVMHSLENWLNDKSTYNNPVGDYIMFDECMDTNRATSHQMVDLQNQISTIGRNRPNCRVVMLGNNTNQYCFWFEEFCIEDDIPLLDFGHNLEKLTDLGTTLYVELIDLSEEKKSEVRNRKIRFSGFSTPKMNAFNGLGAWEGQSHQHIPDVEMLNDDYFVNNRVYIKHRNKYVQLNLYRDDKHGEYVFLHFCRPPKYEDNVVLTITPQRINEVYGYGKFIKKDKLRNYIYTLVELHTSNKWYYNTNSVGDLVDDYFNSIE